MDSNSQRGCNEIWWKSNVNAIEDSKYESSCMCICLCVWTDR